ncbi:MAG TPA: hypothetical protein EYG48_09315 [Methylococcales bacterium]|nr:hypothetical protein [Methylococcales bacterium]
MHSPVSITSGLIIAIPRLSSPIVIELINKIFLFDSSGKKSLINDGILEGLNSVLQTAKSQARGYKIRHFTIITYLLTGKLDFSKINANCLPT